MDSISRVRRTRSWRSVCLYPRSKWKMVQNCWQFQNRNVQTFGFVYHDTKGLNHGPVWKIQSFFSKGICTVILQQDYRGKGNLKKFHLETVGKISNWECLVVNQENGLSCLCMWTTKNCLEETNIDPIWKVLMKEVDLWEPTSSHDHVNLGCTQRRCEISKDTGKLHKYASWQTRRINNSTQYLLHALTTTPIQRRRIGIFWKIIKSMLTECSELLILGTYWPT